MAEGSPSDISTDTAPSCNESNRPFILTDIPNASLDSEGTDTTPPFVGSNRSVNPAGVPIVSTNIENADTATSSNESNQSVSPSPNASIDSKTQTDSITAITSSATNGAQDSESKEKIDKIKRNIGIVLDKPISPHFAILARRIETYRKVPARNNLDPDSVERFALAGFVFNEVKNLLECFHCSCTISDWYEKCHDRNQDPWKLHVLTFPYCAHVRQCKTDRFILELLNDDELDTAKSDKTPLHVFLAIERNKNAIDAARTIFDFTENELHNAVEMFVCQKGKLTFRGKELCQKIDELRTNTKATADIKGNPKSEEGEGTSNENVNHDDNDSNTIYFNDTCVTDDDADNVASLLEENERLKSNLTCKICLMAEACIITLPCGHMITCPQCISALASCAICRSEVKGTVRALYASVKP